MIVLNREFVEDTIKGIDDKLMKLLDSKMIGSAFFEYMNESHTIITSHLDNFVDTLQGKLKELKQHPSNPYLDGKISMLEEILEMIDD